MSDAEIRSDAASSAAQASALETAIAPLGDISLSRIAETSVGIPGASLHDDATSAIETNLRSWVDLIYAGVDAIRETGLAFDGADKEQACMLLGI